MRLELDRKASKTGIDVKKWKNEGVRKQEDNKATSGYKYKN
jgi:hypothetical protein